jgi:thiamine monophosphate synthase
MSNSRREFLQTGAALTAGLIGGSQLLHSEGSGREAQPGSAAHDSSLLQQVDLAPVQVPRMKFGNAEISRMVIGVNPLYGFAHYNMNFSRTMAEWYTQERVCEVLHRANAYGINAFNYVTWKRSPEDWARFVAEGGKMHLIAQVAAKDDVAALVRDMKPLAVHRQGEVVDVAFREGKMDTVREWCKQVRDMGVMVGVGTHKPEVIALVEEQAWDVDFYAGCVYNRTRTAEEWKKALGGEIVEMPREIYLQSDPARMYAVMRQTTKPCFAFKILAAGRIEDQGIAGAFRTAFQSIKANDGVFVGMFPRYKDEVKENAEIVHRMLAGE